MTQTRTCTWGKDHRVLRPRNGCDFHPPVVIYDPVETDTDPVN